MTQEFMMIDIDLIDLDETNPRIADYLANYPNVTAEAISLALGAGRDTGEESSTTFSSLQRSILANGGVINPIIVRKKNDNRYVAVEGNTRLCIYKEFQKDGKPGDWSKIKAICYKDINQNEIEKIRLQAHLVGPRPWDAYAKAKYLYELHNIHGMTLDELVPYCGGKASDVKSMIDAYKDVEEYYRPVLLEKGMLFHPKKFSAFRELQNKTVQDAITRAGFTKTNFSEWVADENIDTMQGPRFLPKILADKEATVMFLKKNVSEARKILNAKEVKGYGDLSSIPLQDLINELDHRFDKFPYTDLISLRTDPDKDQLRYSIMSLNGSMGIIIDGLDEVEQ